MASIQRFEEIEAWKKGRELTQRIYQVTAKTDFARDFTLKDQIKRAAILITSNIAEGFERGGNREFIQFLTIAKGSASGLKSQLYTAMEAGYLTKAEFAELYELAHSTLLLLGGFVKYLQQSELRGRKFRTVSKQENPEP